MSFPEIGRQEAILADETVRQKPCRSSEFCDAYDLSTNSQRKGAVRHPSLQGIMSHTKRRYKPSISNVRTSHGYQRDIFIVAETQGDLKRQNILVHLEDYNNSTKFLADQEKASEFLHSSSNLRKAECEQLKKKLSAAIINSGGEQRLRPAEGTPSMSASQTFKSSKLLRKIRRTCDREPLRKEILEVEIPVRLRSHILSYFDDCLCYAHIFIAEMCDGSWDTYSTACSRAPN